MQIAAKKSQCALISISNNIYCQVRRSVFLPAFGNYSN